FDGRQRTPYDEDTCPQPIQMYGITKLAGELSALAEAPALTTIIRTCGLYGMSGAQSKGGNFVEKRIADGLKGLPFDMSSDQIVCPTSTSDLATAIYTLLVVKTPPSGIYHLVCEGECTWYSFTKAILEHLNISTEVRPVDRDGFNANPRRP